MEPLVIKGTEKTPEINFNAQTGKLYVGGRSYSSDAFDFYKPVTAWVNHYMNDPRESTSVDINVDYFHSVSVKYLTTIVKRLAQLQDLGKKVEVTWYHQPDQEDEDEAYDLGKSIEAESRIKFRYVETAR